MPLILLPLRCASGFLGDEYRVFPHLRPGRTVPKAGWMRCRTRRGSGAGIDGLTCGQAAPGFGAASGAKGGFLSGDVGVIRHGLTRVSRRDRGTTGSW